MNKSELIAAVAESTESSKAAAGRAVDATLAAITEALSKGDQISLIGFGAFSVRERAARPGRDPRTGKKIKITASQVTAFRAGKGLKDAVK